MSYDKKKCRKYKAGNKYWRLCMEEKLAIASYNNPNELLNQRSEILNVCRLKKNGYLVDKNKAFLICYFLNSFQMPLN